MALHLVLSRYELSNTEIKFNISRISYYSESEEWSTIHLCPQFPKKIKAKYLDDIECSGGGLLCFCYEVKPSKGYRVGDFDHVIWNPSTHKFQLLPPTDSINLLCGCSSGRRCVRSIFKLAHGLGFVAESHDYKFVRFIHNDIEIEDDCDYPSSSHVAVYSSKNNSWKELPYPFDFEDISPIGYDAVCVNGFLYWRTMRDVMLSFDMSTDKFSILPYPDDVAPEYFKRGYDYDASFLGLDGALYLAIQFEKKDITTTLFSFWVYTPSSPSPSPWTRKINLDVCLDAKHPLWLGRKSNGGEFLLLQGFDGALLEFDYTTRELKLIHNHHRGDDGRMVIFPYVETNTSIAENNDIVDRISQLPNDLILRILPLISLKEAASTSVLSTRWLDLWRHTPNLNFHDTHLKKRFKSKYINWVNSVVESHKALYLKEFNITFPIGYSTQRTVIKWLKYAFSRRVEVLELNLLGSRFAFLQSKLKSTNLRSLCLKCLEVSGEAIGLLLRNCPLLERLIIGHAVLTSDLEVCGSALKHLDIQYCKGGILIKGYAPNLTCLRIDSCPFTLEEVEEEVDYYPTLVWATQQSADSPPLFISSTLTTLEFTLHYPPKDFFEKRIILQMPTLRELIITYHGCGHGIRPITTLIYAFPYLEEFEIKQYTRGRLIEQQGMEAMNNVEIFCHCHLRVFKFAWFNVGDGDHMELMSYILDNCVALQKIILDIYGDDLPSYVAAREYAKQLQSKLPIHIQLIISFNNRQLV